jgi:FSR family fosmidomycin resistance protein-like MFS transporter
MGAAAEITKRQRGVLLATTVAGHGLKHLFSAAFFVLLPEIKTSLGLTNVEVGLMSTARFVSGGIANLPAGFIADRFSRWRAEILGTSIALIGVFAFALGTTHSFWLATLAASLIVIAISFWHPAAISSLSRQFASRRGLAISLHGTGGSFGEAAGPVIAGLALGYFGWRALAQGSIAPAIFAGIAIWALLKTVPNETAASASVRGYLRSLGITLRNRRLLLILIFAGGFSAGQSVTFTFLPIYLREDLDVSSATLGFYLGLAQIVGVGSQPMMGYLSDRLGRKLVLTPALAALGASFAALAIAPAGVPFVITVAIMGAFLFPLMSILLAAALDVIEVDVQGTTVSLVFGAATIVASTAPTLAGLLGDQFGLKSTFLFASAVMLLTSLIAAVTRWQAPRI